MWRIEFWALEIEMYRQSSLDHQLINKRKKELAIAKIFLF